MSNFKAEIAHIVSNCTALHYIYFCRVLTGANRDIRRPCQMYLHQAFVRLHLFHKQCLLFKVMKCIK